MPRRVGKNQIKLLGVSQPTIVLLSSRAFRKVTHLFGLAVGLLCYACSSRISTSWNGFFSVPVDGVLDEKEGEKKRGGGSHTREEVQIFGPPLHAPLRPARAPASRLGNCYFIRIRAHTGQSRSKPAPALVGRQSSALQPIMNALPRQI